MIKNNLDKLFRDKLRDFQEVPDERVWESIEQSLDQRRKSKRVIPIWWKLGGVAAILAIALFVINPFGAEEPSGTTITDNEKSVPVIDPADSEEMPGNFEQNQDAGAGDITTVADDDNPEITNESQQELMEAEESRIAAQPDQIRNDADSNELNIYKQDRNEVVSNIPEADKDDYNKLQLQEDREEIIVADTENKDPNAGDENKSIDRPALAEQDPIQNEEELFKATDTEVVVQDSKEEITEDQSGKKSIFDEIDQPEEEALAESSGSKWAVGPSVAPVYFNSFGEGSPIHSNFASNSKSGNVNLSYGVGVSYEISDKLRLRSGLHKVDYGYDTNDISFSSSLVASTSTLITNINYTSTSKNLVVESSSRTEAVQDVSANDIIAPSPSRNGRMIQEFGYLEIPMELNYALLDSKLNIDLIGGVSSLLLINNSVTLESAGTSTEMGEANNLNDVNFSTNVGLGINYELNDKMKVHLEPMFKYQLNTFSDIEGNFQPYSVGIYTGMSFKF